jgi:hypothetical protein
MLPRPPLSSPPPMRSGPSTAGRALAIIVGLLVLALAIGLYPTFRALNGAIVGVIERAGPLIGWIALFFGLTILIGLAGLLFARVRTAYHTAEQAAIIKAPSGMPIHLRDVPAAKRKRNQDGLAAQLLPQSLADTAAEKLAESSRPFPQLHSYHQAVQHAPPAQLSAAPEPPPRVLPIPTFAQLLDSGQIGEGRPLILGYDAGTGQPITGAWKDLYSCGVGALQGAGKTWLLAFLLGQSAAAGGRLIICDLHAGDDESLANRIGALAPAFMCDIASTPKEIESAFAFADDKLEKRKTNSARWPIVLVADEWTSLLRTSAGTKLPSHIQNIAEQGRKFNVNGILAAQAWTKAASSDVRNQLTSHYVMRQRQEEARYQLGLRADQLPEDIRKLPDATGYLLNVQGDLVKIIVPFMTARDLARCGELIPSPAGSPPKFGFLAPTDRLPPAAPAELRRKSDGTQTELNVNVSSSAAASATPVSPEAARAAALFHDGVDIADIIRALRGELTGRARQQASIEIQQLIREGRS